MVFIFWLNLSYGNDYGLMELTDLWTHTLILLLVPFLGVCKFTSCIVL